MTKPHEVELRHTDSGVHGGYLVDVATGADVAVIPKDYEHLRPLLAASPDMARALRNGFEAFESFGDEACDHALNICWCAQQQALASMKAALRKAKVLP